MTTSVIPERNRLAVSIVKLASRAVLSPFFKINVRGIDNIPEKESFVLLTKHQRWEDIPLIAISIKRPLYFIAKKELFDSGFSKRFFAMLGGLPLDRNSPTVRLAFGEPVAHQPNEYCRITDIIEDTKVLASIFLDDSIE